MLKALATVQNLWSAAARRFGEKIDVLPPEELIEGALLDGRLKGEDDWRRAMEFVRATESKWAFPSFCDLFFEQILGYARLKGARLDTVSDLVSVIHGWNGRPQE